MTMLLVFTGGILSAYTVKGRVFSGNQPIAGVVVTDGKNFTVTASNGRYTLEVSEEGRFVYVSLPSGYTAPVSEGVVKFYKQFNPKVKSYDFELIKKDGDDTNHGFVVVADPQIYAAKEFPLLREGVEDIRRTVSEYPVPFHGIGAGDLISHDHNLYQEYNSVMSNSGIPFFNVMGNHDMVVYGRSHETSFHKFESVYGPHYYSFNVGKVHYVMLNDNFFIGRDYFYIGYITENQLAWLEKDLSYVPEGTTVVVTMHIPTSVSEQDRKSFNYQKAGSTMANHRGLYKILEPYNAHIISGHTHTNHNVVIRDNLFEHVTAAMSGAWWQGSLCTDGTPKGYGVYFANGDSLSWYYKATGKPKDYQMRVYTGEDDAAFKGYIVANVWNWDPSWKVDLYEDGVFSSPMEQFEGYDPMARDMYSDKDKLEHKWIWPSVSDKFFRAKPKSGNSSLSVVATDRFGNRYEQSLPHRSHYDVVVVGGGASGTAAGIKAASMGVRTLVIEEHEWLGGMLTSAGVSATDGNHKLRGGLWGTFRDSLESYYGGPEALNTGWVSRTLFEPSVGNRIFKNIASKYPKLSVWYNSVVRSMEKQQNGWSLTVSNGAGKKKITASILVDATELGDIAAKAGVRYDLGMDSRLVTGEYIAPEQENDIIQDLTYAMVLKEYDRDMTIQRPAGYNPSLFYCSTISKKCTNPKEEKRLWSPEMMITYGKLPNGKYMINWPIEGNDYYLNVVEMSREERIRELEKAKQHSLSFLYYIQTELGFKNLALADDEFPTDDKFPFIPYHRESRRIDGVVRLTLDHIKDPYANNSTLYRTAIAVGDYPVDHHHTRYHGWENLPDLHFYPVPSYGLPLGTLIPKETEDLIVAEKSISVTNLVNGTTRLQPVVLQIGEAAGILAALAVKQGIRVRDVAVRDVQRGVLDGKGYILPYLDLATDHPNFKALQRIGATGIMKGTGMNVGWENQTWFHADSTITNRELLEGALPFYMPQYTAADSASVFDLQKDISLTDLAKMFSFADNGKTSAQFLNAFNEEWKSLGLLDYDAKRALTRLECAVLIDKFIDPFGRYNVGHKGELLPLLEQHRQQVEGNHPAVRYTGRILDNGDGSVSFDWSGTYLEVAFTGGYLAIRVSDTKKNYYNLFVNGKQQGVVTTFGKDSLIVLAKGLGKKQNIVRLQKRTEAEQGKTTIHAFELAAKGELVPYDPDRTRHIEFIGNSITAGFGTEGLSKDEPFKPETENCNLAFGAIISRYFNSDYTFIAHSGWGAARNYGDTARVSKTSMKDRMMQTFDMYPQPQWSFNGYTPDLVVINLGSNDFSTKPHPLKEEFMAAYDIIIKNIRTKYGNIPVLCVAPPLRGMAFEYIKEYCDKANDPKLFFTAYLAGVHNRDSDLGSVGHPNYNGQRKIAQNLIPYISTITGWPMENKPVE